MAHPVGFNLSGSRFKADAERGTLNLELTRRVGDSGMAPRRGFGQALARAISLAGGYDSLPTGLRVSSFGGRVRSSDVAVPTRNSKPETRNSVDAYTSILAEASKQYQVESALLAGVMEAESGFNTRAVSAAGARGLMQLMDPTARSLGVTDSFDPRQNILGGAKLLRQLMDRYAGNTRLALAAYNAGSGAVDRYGDVPPYAETLRFVPKVLEATERFRRQLNSQDASGSRGV